MIAAKKQSASMAGSPALAPPRAIYKGHIAELDAIRAFAVAIVLLDHFWPKTLSTAIYSVGQMAWIAMDAFFVLSGFLITSILVDTRSTPDYFRNYYVRRALRIFPLYYVVLLAAIAMLKLTPGGAGYRDFVHNWGSPEWFAVYLGNIRTAYLGAWPPTSTMGVMWSLQIEEQFYLLFPLLVRWMRLEHLSRLLWCLVFLSPVCRIALYLVEPEQHDPSVCLAALSHGRPFVGLSHCHSLPHWPLGDPEDPLGRDNDHAHACRLCGISPEHAAGP